MSSDTNTTQRISRELGFFGLGFGTNQDLQLILDGIERYAGGALDQLYGHIRGDRALAALFSRPGAMQHARDKQMEHWRALFSNGINAKLLQSSENIGLIHVRIGLEPAWYIGGYALVIERVVAGMMAQSARRRLSGTALSSAITTLIKMAMFDMQIGVSSYFKAAGEERGQAIGRIGSALSAIANGDVSNQLTGLGSEYHQIELDFEEMRSQMHSALSEVASAAEEIRSSSTEIANASTDLARRTEQQAASVEETAAAMEQITTTVKQTATGAQDVRRTVKEAAEDAASSGGIVTQAVEAMAAIKASSDQISQIVSVIDGIAFQTNLLALNAGVEAARAGDAGMGFAVVANEVRALAQRSADAARDIKNLIGSSSAQVEAGVSLVGQTGDALQRIAQRIGDMNDRISDIANASETQAHGITEINAAIGSMDRATQQNAAMVEQSTASANSMTSAATRLSTLVARFSLNKLAGRAASTAPRRAASR